MIHKRLSYLNWLLGCGATLAIIASLSAPAAANPFKILEEQSEKLQTVLPPSLKPLAQQVLTPNGLLLLIGGGAFFVWANQDEGNKKNKLANAKWAAAKEKKLARQTAFRQINERKRNGLTTWINAPKIVSLKNPKLDGKKVRRYRISPKSSTIFIPDGQRGTAVAGAPGSGKTFSVIDPMIRSVIEQGFPIVLYDFKFPSQAECHAAYAEKQGYDVKIFAPGFPGTESCNFLDFLRDADDAETAAQIAKTLNKNFSLNGGRGGDDQFFQLSGDQLIKATLQLAKMTRYPDLLTCQKILSIEQMELIDRVRESQLSPWVRVTWDQFLSMKQSEKTASGVAATASLMFSNFVSPDLLPCLCGKSTIPLDLQGKQMLVFGMDQNRRDIIGPILATVLHMIVTRNIAKQRKDPLAVFLDELPTIALPSLVNWLNESRSAGFCGTLGFQNMTQLEKAYGKESARAIISGCNTKFVFNPGEYESAKYFSDYLGEEEIRYKQKSRSSGKSGAGTNISDQERTKKLLSPEEVLKLPPGSCVFINPAYSNKSESGVPVKLKVRISKEEQSKQESSQDQFASLLTRLKSNSKLVPIGSADILLRERELDQVIPKPNSQQPSSGGAKPGKSQPAQTLAELLQSAAEEFDSMS